MNDSVIESFVPTSAGILRDSSHAAGTYVNWGVLHISLANLVIIVAMIVIFAIAVLAPYPHKGDDAETKVGQE